MSNTRTTTRTTRKPRTATAKAEAPTVTFMGAKYRVADKIGVWPQLQLARVAQDGLMLNDMRSLAAVHATLQNVIHPDDWPRFEGDMITKKADDLLELMKLMQQAVQLVAERATSAAAKNGTPVLDGKVVAEE